MRIPHGLRAALAGQAAPPAPSSDPDFENVSLLLHGDGTNGAQNNTFIDGSTNNFTITRNGNTTQGTFSPFSPTGWSGYFDGNGDYLVIPDNASLDLTNDFTIECYIFITGDGIVASGTTTDRAIISKKASNTFSSPDWLLSYDITTDAVEFNLGNSLLLSSGVIDQNQWHHIAISRQSGTVRLYLNGIIAATGTNNNNLSTTWEVWIGLNQGSNRAHFEGYISNVRIVKGTAVYTSNFTPPTSPLTAITNTSLLTLQDNRFKDNSTNNFTITRNGDTRIEAFSPFNPTAAYSASTHGGSGYFDGTGDYLSIADDTALDLGTGDYTIEGWVYLGTGNVDNAGIITKRGAGTFSAGDFRISYRTTTSKIAFADNTSTEQSTPVVLLNTWVHFVVVRSGTTLSVYANGVRGDTITNTTNLGNAEPVLLGRNATLDFKGYMSDVRVVKGTAVYDPTQATIAVPTAPLTAITNTSLLLNFTNGGIIDNASKNVLETVGNAQISTSVKKFGTGSMYFDGTSNTQLIIPASNNLGLETANFTIEFWLYLNSVGSNMGIVCKGPTTSGGWLVRMNGSKVMFVNQANANLTSTTSLSANTWYHVAVVREGIGTNQTKLYIDGVTEDTSTLGTNFVATLKTYIGSNRGSTVYLNGYIDDLRITKGVARYTANFTPPTQAFPDL